MVIVYSNFIDDDNKNKYKHICSCGHEYVAFYPSRCSECGCEERFDSSYVKRQRILSRQRIVKILDIGEHGLKAQYINTKIIYNKEENKFIFDYCGEILDIDLIYPILNASSSSKYQNYRSVNFDKLLRELDIAINRLRKNDQYTEKIKKFEHLLQCFANSASKQSKSLYYELNNFLPNSDKDNNMAFEIARNITYSNFLPYIYNAIKFNKYNKDKPIWQNLEISKALFKQIIQLDDCFIDVYSLQNISRVIPEQKINELFKYKDRPFFNEIFYNYRNAHSSFVGLCEHYKNNYDRFFDYFFNSEDVRYDMSLLFDYVRMSVENNLKYVKYPKDIEACHDKAVKIIKHLKNKENEESFNIVRNTDEYLENEYKNDDYSIIAPPTVHDVINEGDNLNHCVATYIKYITDRKSKIYFMRSNKALETSLVTLEIKNAATNSFSTYPEHYRTQQGGLVQARGKNNRSITKEEELFLKEWCKNKNIFYNI